MDAARCINKTSAKKSNCERSRIWHQDTVRNVGSMMELVVPHEVKLVGVVQWDVLYLWTEYLGINTVRPVDFTTVHSVHQRNKEYLLVALWVAM